MHQTETDHGDPLLRWIGRWPKRLVLIGVVLCAAVLVGICWDEPPYAAEAKLRASQLNVVEFDLGRLDRESIGTRKELLIRGTVEGGSKLLFRRGDGRLVAAYDASNASVTWATPAEWTSAEGEIIDDVQVGVAGEWNFDESAGQLKRLGRRVQTVAPNHLVVTDSPSGDKIAVITADGRFDPGEIGLVFGGSHKRASGQHYVEILSKVSGMPLMEPVAIPFRTGKQRTLDLLWSSDERFVICRATSQYCVIPTAPEPLLSSR